MLFESKNKAYKASVHMNCSRACCTFTICASDGSVVGCADVPDHNGLKASHRDLKKKLFEECGVTYAVLNVNQLPTLEALRAVFLGDMALMRPPSHGRASTSQMPSS